VRIGEEKRKKKKSQDENIMPCLLQRATIMKLECGLMPNLIAHPRTAVLTVAMSSSDGLTPKNPPLEPNTELLAVLQPKLPVYIVSKVSVSHHAPKEQ